MPHEAKPFLKWAGGKRRLLTQFENHYPDELRAGKIKKYVEPFLGGGAVYFSLQSKYKFKKVILNDINHELMLSYKVVQNNIKELISILQPIEEKFNKMTFRLQKLEYYKIRKDYNLEKLKIDKNEPADIIENVAKFIFLNKTCFNGLYRINKKGMFNVPFGRYIRPRIFDEPTLRGVNKALKGVKLMCEDYKNVENCIDIDDETFIYIDPPYRPLPETVSFTSYSKEDFLEKDQVELSNWFKDLDEKGAYLMLSNSDPTNTDPEDRFFEEHYNGFKIDKVFAGRIINSRVNGRRKITELVIKNYPK
ncbi:Dam family site-specific DNA-(adenine-N6)-methyltransferase [Methanococcus maripaludis]|uniref:site-specific DNA-methyltransferase (adenine-specific) n=2 Tax=Methanococcus maripaludis TaxID=39152 RepID=A0A7J9PHR2_METMI|nr:Dam family site-specific DNA-(adenine-N6)-methyltransferase [Methanococcus maripaludis]MBA2862651.1 DNA adenine methylase [Methanococcus maripaludis]